MNMDNRLKIIALVIIISTFLIVFTARGYTTPIEVHGSIEAGTVNQPVYADRILTKEYNIMFFSFETYLQLFDFVNVGGSIRNDFIKGVGPNFIPLVNYYKFFVEIYYRNISFGFRHQCSHSDINSKLLTKCYHANFTMLEYNGGYQEIYVKVKF